MTILFHSAPARLCFAPGRTFTSLHEATAFAIEAASHWGVVYVVWQSRAGRIRRLATYPPHYTRRTPS
jgi:hypothetical protein